MAECNFIKVSGTLEDVREMRSNPCYQAWMKWMQDAIYTKTQECKTFKDEELYRSQGACIALETLATFLDEEEANIKLKMKMESEAKQNA